MHLKGSYVFLPNDVLVNYSWNLVIHYERAWYWGGYINDRFSKIKFDLLANPGENENKISLYKYNKFIFIPDKSGCLLIGDAILEESISENRTNIRGNGTITAIQIDDEVFKAIGKGNNIIGEVSNAR
jgi:hypothetical protein